MHMKSQGVALKFPLLGIKEEDTSLTTYKESLGRLSYQPLMMKGKGEMMLNLGCLESRNIFSCTTTHLT
jgi:hypothetical protein